MKWWRPFTAGGAFFDRLIGSVVAATAAVWILKFLHLAFNLPVGHWWQFFALPGELSEFFGQPWSLVTYAWVHTNLINFLFNLILLYYIGTLFLTYEPPSRMWKLFLAGIIGGGIAFLLSNKWIPFLYKDEPEALLTGISAGYVTWLAWLAARYGDQYVYIRLIGRVRIRHIFYFFLALDFLLLFTYNSGGHIAHLAAALIGWSWAKYIDRPRRTAPSRIYDNYKPAREKEIDRILDKINRSGFDSLTEREKEILYRESERHRKG